MCGASQEQKDLNASQTAFYNQLTKQYESDYSNNQDILNTLKTSLAPIVAGGPSQQGFSPEETSALKAQAAEGAASAYRSSAQALNQRLAAGGGGNIPITGGAVEQIKSGLDLSALENENNQNLDITKNSFETGRQNFLSATGLLSGVPTAIESPLSGAAGAATGAGNAAAEEANAINASNKSWMGLVGGLASSAVGGMTSPGGLLGGKPK